jgi:RNA polymerase sigma factor (sigma-70 family)
LTTGATTDNDPSSGGRAAAVLHTPPDTAQTGAEVQHDDSKLIADCLKGRPRAWDELIERYSRLIYSIPLRAGLSTADADDVVQIVWGIVLRKLDTLREVDRLSAWLIRTTYRESWRRGRLSRRHAGVDEAAADPSAPDEDEVSRWERQHIVRQSLDQLDERCRKLLRALFFDGQSKSYEQIAADLGMKIGSIGPTRARCFKNLEKILTKAGL